MDYKNVVNDLKAAFGLTKYVEDMVGSAPNEFPELPMTKDVNVGFFAHFGLDTNMVLISVLIMVLLTLVFFIATKYTSGRLIVAGLAVISFIVVMSVSFATAKVSVDVFQQIDEVDRLIKQHTSINSNHF